jgi:hypothetical protein
VSGLGVLAVGLPGPGIIGESGSGEVGVQGCSQGVAVRGDGGRFGFAGTGTATGVDGTGTFGVVGRGTATNVDGQGFPVGAASFGVVGVGSVASVVDVAQVARTIQGAWVLSVRSPAVARQGAKSPSSERGLNVPAGGSRSSTLPARTCSAIQFDANPRP